MVIVHQDPYYLFQGKINFMKKISILCFVNINR